VLEWLDELLIPELDSQLMLLAIDLFRAHQTIEVLDTFQANKITPSIIPGGCTGLVQPLDISVNGPFKNILRLAYVQLYLIEILERVQLTFK